MLRWHRELVRRKWAYPNKNKGERSSISKETESLILRLARENSRFGYGKVASELLKLGFQVSLTTVRNVPDRCGIQPVPVRNGSIGWHYLMTHYKEQILAYDFFAVEIAGSLPDPGRTWRLAWMFQFLLSNFELLSQLDK